MRRYPSPALLVLACGAVLVACTPAPQPPQTAAEAVTAAAAPATSATEPTPVAAASECPYPEFDTFLKHFGNEITLQEKATADPLLDSYIDAEAEPEPRKVESRLALADVEWPVMPDPAALAGQGREMQVSPPGRWATAGADPYAGQQRPADLYLRADALLDAGQA